MTGLYLLIDIENVYTRSFKKGLEQLKYELNNDGYFIHKVGIAAKDHNHLFNCLEICRKVFNLDNSNLFSIICKAGKESADMALCFIAGYWCCENLEFRLPFLILSNDNILNYVKLYINGLGQETLDYSLITEQKKEKEAYEPLFSIEKYPFIYDKTEPIFPCLEVINVPVERTPLVKMIPIHNILEDYIITLGKNIKELTEENDNYICLEFWDNEKHTIYENHAFLGYHQGKLFISDTKGLRRGKHAFYVNEELISNANGKVFLNDGDQIKMGCFTFKVHLPKMFISRPLYDGNQFDEVIKNIELLLHKWVRETLESISKDWWNLYVRGSIITGCKERSINNIEHPYNFTFIKDLDVIISDNWSIFEKSISQLQISKKKFRKMLSKYIQIRNLAMHPTRMNVEEDDVVFISDFYSIINCITSVE